MSFYNKMGLAFWAIGIAGAWWMGLYAGFGWVGIGVITWIIGMIAVVIAGALSGKLYGSFGIRD